MSFKKTHFVLLIATMVMICSCKKNKDAREPTIVFGQITDHLTGEPLEGVIVSWGYTDNMASPIKVDSTVTDEEGRYDLRFEEDMHTISWKLWFTAANYQGFSIRANVGDVTELNFGLYPE